LSAYTIDIHERKIREKERRKFLVMRNLVSPFESKGNWYRANLHTHTTDSDGEAGVEERVEQYKQKGYDILAITDHSDIKKEDNSVHSTKDFLVISGMETGRYSPQFDVTYHLVCLNVPVGFEVPEGIDADALIKLIRKAGGEVIVGHPYWCGHNINELLAVEGNIAIEVYNSTCTKIGKGFSSVHWDNLLDAGRIIGATAVDDTHRGRDIFMGWTMIKAKQLTLEAVMDALRNGCYYASCGPAIKDFRLENGRASVKCSPAAEVHFMCNRATGLSFYTDGGEPITQAEYEPPDGIKYIRAEVVDEQGRHAWTNPIIPEQS